MEKFKNEISPSFELSKNQKKISKKVKELMYKIKQINGAIKTYNLLSTIAFDLEEKYPDAKKYYLFHTLICSTVDFNSCQYFDFPEGDSIFKKIEKIYQKINSKK